MYYSALRLGERPYSHVNQPYLSFRAFSENLICYLTNC